MEKKNILRELTKDAHMPSFCDEEGWCEALEDCIAIDANECSFCNINRIVKAFNRGIEFQKQKSPWISVEDNLPYNNPNNIHFGFTNNVLATDGKNIFIMHMKECKDGKYIWCSGNDNVDLSRSITYWMPIPKLSN